MANTEFSNYIESRDDAAAMDGTELVVISQGGNSRKVTTQDIADLGGSAVDSVNGETGVVVLDAGDVGADPSGSAAAAQAASQPLDSDLTAISAISPSNDDIIQRKAGAWTNRTMVQLAADLTTLSSAFVETATVYVDAAGNDSTGAIGRADKPFLTITAALAAGVAVTSLRIKIGMGTFASPSSANLRANLWLEGSGKPGYNNTNTLTAFATITITDPTALLGGTILQGTLFFQDKSNVHITDLGVDGGSAYVTGGGTEGNQIAFLSATITAPWVLMTNIVVKNVTTLGRTAGSLFHGIQIENGFKPIVQNCDTYFSTHGIVLKSYGGIVNNVRCNFHTSDAIIFKTDTYAISWINQLLNFEVQGGGGVYVHLGSGTTTGGVNGAIISNGILRSPTFGVLVQSSTASMVHYIRLNNIVVYGSSGVGFNIANAQSTSISNCTAVGCTTGFLYVGTSTNTYGHLFNNIAEGNGTGFNVTGGASGNVFMRGNAARGSTGTGYVIGTNVYGDDNDADTNSTLSSGAFVMQAAATLNFGSVAAQSSADLTITVAGANIFDRVALGTPAAQDANSCYTAWVSAVNTVTVRFNNYSAGAIDPASGTFAVKVFRMID